MSIIKLLDGDTGITFTLQVSEEDATKARQGKNCIPNLYVVLFRD